MKGLYKSFIHLQKSPNGQTMKPKEAKTRNQVTTQKESKSNPCQWISEQSTAWGNRHCWGPQAGTEPKGLHKTSWLGWNKQGFESKVQGCSRYCTRTVKGECTIKWSRWVYSGYCNGENIHEWGTLQRRWRKSEIFRGNTWGRESGRRMHSKSHRIPEGGHRGPSWWAISQNINV